MGDTDHTEAENIAGLIESAAAWWQLASRELAAGDLEAAERYAYLGHLGTDGMRQRISALAQEVTEAR